MVVDGSGGMLAGRSSNGRTWRWTKSRAEARVFPNSGPGRDHPKVGTQAVYVYVVGPDWPEGMVRT